MTNCGSSSKDLQRHLRRIFSRNQSAAETLPNNQHSECPLRRDSEQVDGHERQLLSGVNIMTDTINLANSIAISDRSSVIDEKLNNGIDEVVLQVCKFGKADECNLQLLRNYTTSINNENDRLRTENIALNLSRKLSTPQRQFRT